MRPMIWQERLRFFYQTPVSFPGNRTRLRMCACGVKRGGGGAPSVYRYLFMQLTLLQRDTSEFAPQILSDYLSTSIDI